MSSSPSSHVLSSSSSSSERPNQTHPRLSVHRYFTRAVKELEGAGKAEERLLKMDPLYSCAVWKDVRKFHLRLRRAKVAYYTHDEDDTFIRERELEEGRRRMLVSMKSSYMNQFHRGMLPKAAAREMVEITDNALDRHCDMQEWDHGISQLMTVSKSSHILHRVVHWPCIGHFVLQHMFHRLTYGYDAVASFIVARESAMSMLKEVVSYEDNFIKIQEMVVNDVQKARQALMDIQRTLPEIAASIQTSHAARAILNAQRKMVQHLTHDGLLDSMEHDRALNAVEMQMHQLQRHPPELQLPQKDQLIQEVPFLHDLDYESLQVVKNRATEVRRVVCVCISYIQPYIA